MTALLGWPTALLVYILLSLPGWILISGRDARLWMWIAAGFSSMHALLLASALLAVLMPGQTGVWIVAPIAIVASLAAWIFGRGGDNSADLRLPKVEPWALLAPAATGALALFIYQGAFQVSAAGVEAHAWYNADWFKHLGHVHALVNAGMPARDIFGGNAPLAYYWLYYQVPALGAWVHGDVESALLAAGLLQTLSSWVLVYGLIREIGLSPRLSAALSTFAWLTFAMGGTAALFVTRFNAVGVAENFIGGSGLFFRLNLYVPQHQMMFCGLISWALLFGVGVVRASRPLSALAHAPLAAAGAVSTLLGIVCLGVYGATRLLTPGSWLSRIAVPALVGLLALVIVFALGVIDPSLGSSTMASPAFSEPDVAETPLQRLGPTLVKLIFALGPAAFFAPLGLAAFARHGGSENRALTAFGIALAGVGTAAFVGAHVFLPNARLAHELGMRALVLVALGLLLGVAMLVRDYQRRDQPMRPLWLAFGAALLIGLPSPILDTIWHYRSGSRHKTIMPADDMAAMRHLRANSGPDALVLQYPEPPFLAGGGKDSWVPIFAGRTIAASDRSTDYQAALPRLESARRFYAGAPEPIAPDVDWVYLSRDLHPATFGALRDRMRGDRRWTERLCLPGACLFERAASRR